jgi:CheY-like chemotaxis protein
MKTLLMVEDGEVEILVMKRSLERIGSPFSLQVARTGDEAVEYLSGAGRYADRQAFPLPDLVLLDLTLPGSRNGHQVLEWIRGRAGLEKLPVTMLTGSLEPADVQKAYQRGVTSYLVKPGNIDGAEKILRQIAADWQVAKDPPK